MMQWKFTRPSPGHLWLLTAPSFLKPLFPWPQDTPSPRVPLDHFLPSSLCTGLLLPTHKWWSFFIPQCLLRRSHSLYPFNSAFILATSQSTCLNQRPDWAPDFNVQLLPGHICECPLSISSSASTVLLFLLCIRNFHCLPET